MICANKFDDCESCAFGGQDHAICDSCEDADQWEPNFEDSLVSTKVKVIKVYKKQKIQLQLKEAA